MPNNWPPWNNWQKRQKEKVKRKTQNVSQEKLVAKIKK